MLGRQFLNFLSSNKSKPNNNNTTITTTITTTNNNIRKKKWKSFMRGKDKEKDADHNNTFSQHRGFFALPSDLVLHILFDFLAMDQVTRGGRPSLDLLALDIACAPSVRPFYLDALHHHGMRLKWLDSCPFLVTIPPPPVDHGIFKRKSKKSAVRGGGGLKAMLGWMKSRHVPFHTLFLSFDHLEAYRQINDSKLLESVETIRFRGKYEENNVLFREILSKLVNLQSIEEIDLVGTFLYKSGFAQDLTLIPSMKLKRVNFIFDIWGCYHQLGFKRIFYYFGSTLEEICLGKVVEEELSILLGNENLRKIRFTLKRGSEDGLVRFFSQQYYRNLQSIEIEALQYGVVTTAVGKAIMIQNPWIERVVFYGSYCQITPQDTLAFITHCSRLTYFSTYFCAYEKKKNMIGVSLELGYGSQIWNSDTGLVTLLPYFKACRTPITQLTCVYSLPNTVIHEIAMTIGYNLHSININFTPEIESHTFRTLVMSCPKLERVQVTNYQQLEDDDLIAMTRYCQQINSILLSDTPNVTTYGAITIIQHYGSKLTTLCITRCDQLQGSLLIPAIVRHCPKMVRLYLRIASVTADDVINNVIAVNQLPHLVSFCIPWTVKEDIKSRKLVTSREGWEKRITFY